MKVIELAFTGYPVTDLARARAFYEGVLGLEPHVVHEEEDKGWIEYYLGDSTLAISNLSAEWKPSSDGPASALEVDDFDSAIKQLREHDARFVIDPFESPVCRIAIILDPDGNSLVIHKRNAGYAG
jgi:catechol 2,3-dioxygenase-like lactoylglutathione lyase family enzyme